MLYVLRLEIIETCYLSETNTYNKQYDLFNGSRTLLHPHQNVYTVCTQEADDEGAHDADNVAGVVEGVGHSEYPSAQAGLQHV